MIDLSPIVTLLESLVKLSNRQLVLAGGGAVAVGQIRDVSLHLGRRLPAILATIERTLQRMRDRLDAMDRMLQAQIRAAAAMGASGLRALLNQLSDGLSIRLDSETQGLLAVQGRNLGWSLRDIVRALRPIARISVNTSQMVGQLNEALRWLRRLSSQIRALHAMLYRQLNRLADILLDGFRSLRVLLWAGFTHTFAWLRQLSLQLHQVLAGLRFGFGVLDSHMVAGFWFAISWLQAIFRQLRDWGMEGLFRTLAKLSGLAGMPIEQILTAWISTLFGGVTDKIGAMADRVIAAIDGLAEKICACGGGGGGGGEPAEDKKSWWDKAWEAGEGFLKNGLWKGLGWGLKKLTPWGRAIDIGLTILDKLGVKDWLWDKTKQGVGWLWDNTSNVITDAINAVGGGGGVGGGVAQGKKYTPLMSDLYTLMPRSIPEPLGADAYLKATDRITRMQDQPLLQMARAGAVGVARHSGNLDLNQTNQIQTTVNITVPAGTPEAQVDFMSNQMRNVFQDQWDRQLRFAGDQFIDATSPASDHLIWKGE